MKHFTYIIFYTPLQNFSLGDGGLKIFLDPPPLHFKKISAGVGVSKNILDPHPTLKFLRPHPYTKKI